VAQVHDLLTLWLERGVDLKRRRVLLWGALDHEGKPEQALAGLLWLDETPGPVELWIHSTGGSVDDTWPLYDAVKTSRNEIRTVAAGAVQSAAGLLFTAGTSGHRYVLPHAAFMYHAGNEELDGRPREIQDRATWNGRDVERWISEMARNTRPPKCRSLVEREAFWRAHSVGEFWLDPREMVAHGIADHIGRPPTDNP
jgi:ATP-dependent Clp protease, protease subunit